MPGRWQSERGLSGRTRSTGMKSKIIHQSGVFVMKALITGFFGFVFRDIPVIIGDLFRILWRIFFRG